MANLSNINNKFIVTDGNNGRVLIGATNDIGATLFANHPSTTAPSLTFNAPAGQVFENEDLQIAFGLNNASPYNGYMQTRFVSAPYYRNLAINPLGGNVGIGTNSPRGILDISKVDGPELFLTRNDGNVAPDDLIGSLTFYNEDSDGPHRSSWVRGYATETFGRKGYLSFATAGVNSTDATEKMRIDSSGNVKIGSSTTGTPAANADDLVIDKGASESGITIISTAASSLRFGDAANTSIGSVEYNHNSNYMRFSTNNAEKMRITSSGQVGIGGTPQTTFADAITIETGASGIIYSEKAATQYNSMSIGSNWYYDTTNSRVEYKNAVVPGATNYLQYRGEHFFRTAVAPTAANDPITWSDRLVILNSGNVGIGTDSPDNILHIRKGDTTYASQVGADTMLFLETTNVSNALQFTSANTGQQYIMFGDDDPNVGWISYSHSDNNLNFRVNGSEKMRIDSTGNVGIGTDSPTDYFSGADNLVVKQASGGGGISIVTDTSSEGSLYFADGTTGGEQYRGGIVYNHNTEKLFLISGGATKATITSGGNVGIGTDSPHNDAGGLSISAISSTDQLYLERTGSATGRYYLGTASNSFYIVDDAQSATRMVIDSSGNVKINTTVSTLGKLSVKSDSGANTFYNNIQCVPSDSTTGGLFIGSNVTNDAIMVTGAYYANAGNYTPTATSASIINMFSGNIVFRANDSLTVGTNYVPTERMRITSGGDFEFKNGTLKVGDSTTAELLIIPTTNNTAPALLQFHKEDTGASTVLQFLQASTQKGSISYTNTTTSFNTTSDYRLKEDLQDFAGLDMVSKIPVYDFKWKTDESRSYGVMAHELQEVLPDAVSGDKDAEEMQGVDYSKIVPLLVKSIQELKAEVEELKSKPCNCNNCNCNK